MISFMRTIIDIPHEVVESLDRLGARDNRSRASLIRDAICDYLKCRTANPDESGAFGIWKKRTVDGLDYQNELRADWNEE